MQLAVQILDLSINTGDLADDSVTSDKLSTTGVTAASYNQANRCFRCERSYHERNYWNSEVRTAPFTSKRSKYSKSRCDDRFRLAMVWLNLVTTLHLTLTGTGGLTNIDFTIDDGTQFS